MKNFTCLLLAIVMAFTANSQTCPAGTTRAMLNWDFLDFFPSAGYGSYTNLAQSQTQRFAFGAQVATITHNYTGSNAPGQDNVHTNVAGADLRFIHNGTITITFSNTVENLNLTLFDIDRSQSVNFNAYNGVTPVNTNLSIPTGSILTITNNNSTTSRVDASATSVANSDNDGNVTLSVTGPLTRITLTVTNTQTVNNGQPATLEDGSFWISNVSACSAGSFPVGYQAISAPQFVNQPGYVITVVDNNVYYVDPSTGKARFIFQDPNHSNLNSVAYDPVNNFIYYAYSLTSNSVNNRALRRYDYNMDTFGVVTNDIRHLGIPTFNVGIESGGASFYNGSLYLGVEANQLDYKSLIWKIDFGNDHRPVSAVQQFSLLGTNQDWADFGVVDGKLVDFNGRESYYAFHHMDLLSNSVTRYNVASGVIPRQTGIDWQGNMYNIGIPGSTGTIGTIVRYNGTTGLVSSTSVPITFNGINLTGSYGDAAEAFKPKLDFGDAPASYEGTGDPAVHEVDSRLMLGTSVDIEWEKRGATALANMDIDNGLAYTTILSDNGTYLTSVTALNNTGAPATVAAWLDFNGDGIFTADEGITVTIPSSPLMQAVDLYWDNAGTQLPANTNTYLRIRITSAANGMTTSNSTGYFYDGEVEDYRVLIELSALTANLINFNAKKINNKHVKLQWTIADEKNISSYILEKSSNGRTWNQIFNQPAANNHSKITYEFDDYNIDGATNYYRVKVIRANNSFFQSDMKKIVIQNITQINFSPNPASNYLNITIQSDATSNAKILLTDMSGRIVVEKNIVVQQGNNQINMPFNKSLAPGIYNASVLMNNEMIKQKIVVAK
jgi:hypothetical protein